MCSLKTNGATLNESDITGWRATLRLVKSTRGSKTITEEMDIMLRSCNDFQCIEGLLPEVCSGYGELMWMQGCLGVSHCSYWKGVTLQRGVDHLKFKQEICWVKLASYGKG